MRKILLLALVGYGVYKYAPDLFGGRTLAVVFQDGGYETFSGITSDLDRALQAPGSVAVILDAGEIVHTYNKTQFMGGWLLDNCPINAVLGQGWLPGQSEALQAAGIEPFCDVVR